MNLDPATIHGVPRPTLPPIDERTVPHMLLRQARQRLDAPLLPMGEVHWTRADAARATARSGAALREAGVARSDLVASMCPNRIEALEVFLGYCWIGAVSVPINNPSKRVQIQYYLENFQARLPVIDAQFISVLAQIHFGRTAVRGIWVVPDPHGKRPGDLSPATIALEPYPHDAGQVQQEDVRPSDTLAVLYTSGTTGPATGVVRTHGHYVLSGAYSAQMLCIVESDVLSTTLPLFHINALNTFAQASIVGCRAVFHEKFSASGFWASAREHAGTVVYLLGAMVTMLLAQPATAAQRAHLVRVGLGGGVPVSAAHSFLTRTGVDLVDGYALTEVMVIISNPPGLRGLGSLRWLRPGFQARVANELEGEVEPGTAGELLRRADEPFAFSNGCFGLPAAMAAAWRNLWFHTGDRVVHEADSSFRFIDRMKDAIRRRGENISSYEVEQALLSHPGVSQVAAFAAPSEIAEDEAMVAVVAQPGSRLNFEDLAAHCARELPYFAVPRYVDLVDDLPRTENGKVQKFKLRGAGVTPGTWKRPGEARRNAAAEP